MGRSKQNKQNAGKDKDGKHRKETKEERRERLKLQEESRQKCLNLLPLAGGVLLVFLMAFGLYVRSVPPTASVKLDADSLQQPQFQGGVPDFMNVDTEPMIKEALEEASEVLKNLEKDREAEAAAGAGNNPENVETIEL